MNKLAAVRNILRQCSTVSHFDTYYLSIRFPGVVAGGTPPLLVFFTNSINDARPLLTTTLQKLEGLMRR
ncbi:hypothetical protein ACTHGU_07050 [Chitinophagaceae bacterium MMS25-I14]